MRHSLRYRPSPLFFLLAALLLVISACAAPAAAPAAGEAAAESPAPAAEAAPAAGQEAAVAAAPQPVAEQPATTAPTTAAPAAVGTTNVVYDLPDLAGRIVVAVTGNDYTPLNFIDPATGKSVGWEYDAVNEICRRLNCVVDWQVTSWDAMIQAVAEGQFDVGMDESTAKRVRRRE